MSALERNAQLPASAADEDLGPGTDLRGILEWRLDYPEATPAGS